MHVLRFVLVAGCLACGGTNGESTEPFVPTPGPDSDADADGQPQDTPDSPALSDTAGEPVTDRYDCPASCARRDALCGPLIGFDCVGFCDAAVQIGLDAGCTDKAEPWVVCTHTMCDLTACSSLGATFANECAAPFCTINFTPSCDTLE